MRTVAENIALRDQKVQKVLGDTEVLIGSFVVVVEDRSLSSLMSSVHYLFGLLELLRGGTPKSYTVAVTKTEVLLIRHSVFGNPKRIDKRFPLRGTLGEVTIAMDGLIEIQGTRYTIPFQHAARAKRLAELHR